MLNRTNCQVDAALLTGMGGTVNELQRVVFLAVCGLG
jgi:hypothetical protein